MKVGIVVPFSWSFWGAVVEHAELQAAALRGLGTRRRTIIGNDPPGQFTRALHPARGRDGAPPPDVIPVGRSVIVPANGSLPNIILSPRSILRIRRVLERERFDLLHLHEPMTPTTLHRCRSRSRRAPSSRRYHASGELGWMRLGDAGLGLPAATGSTPRIAVSEQARASAKRWLPGDYEVVPNGVLIPDRAPTPPAASTASSSSAATSRARACRSCSAPGRRSAGGPAPGCVIVGADPLAVRLLLARLRIADDGIDVLGFLRRTS